MPHFNKQQLERISRGRGSLPSSFLLRPGLPLVCLEWKIYEDSSKILICPWDTGSAYGGHGQALLVFTPLHGVTGRGSGHQGMRSGDGEMSLNGVGLALGEAGRRPLRMGWNNPSSRLTVTGQPCASGCHIPCALL